MHLSICIYDRLSIYLGAQGIAALGARVAGLAPSTWDEAAPAPVYMPYNHT